MTNEKRSTGQPSALQQLPHGNSLASQLIRLEAYLREGRTISTLQAKIELDIYDPPARIFQLRHEKGLNIHTSWRLEYTPEGKPHRVGVYTLLPGNYQAREAS